MQTSVADPNLNPIQNQMFNGPTPNQMGQAYQSNASRGASTQKAIDSEETNLIVKYQIWVIHQTTWEYRVLVNHLLLEAH